MYLDCLSGYVFHCILALVISNLLTSLFITSSSRVRTVFGIHLVQPVVHTIRKNRCEKIHRPLIGKLPTKRNALALILSSHVRYCDHVGKGREELNIMF